MTQEKHLIVSAKTHKKVKLNAIKAGVTIDKYLNLLMTQCKSDVKAK